MPYLRIVNIKIGELIFDQNPDHASLKQMSNALKNDKTVFER